MPEKDKTIPLIVDFATGKKIPLTGAEENRQAVEKYLVNDKGYDKRDIEIDAVFAFVVKNEPYQSRIDLIVNVNQTRFMLIKCVAGSLGSWEREALAAARLADTYQIPFTLVSDGKNVTVLDTITGKLIGKNPADVPSKNIARQYLKGFTPTPFPAQRLEKERLIFRTYDTMNVNTIRND